MIQRSPQRRRPGASAWRGGIRLRAAARPGGRIDAAGLLVLATVALYALGSISGLLHLALTRHEVCAEHGDLVHATHVHRVGPPVAASGPAVALPATPVPHGHDHCGIAGHLRQRGLAAAEPELAPADGPAGWEPVAPVSVEHRPIVPLRLAPKNSPPQVA